MANTTITTGIKGMDKAFTALVNGELKPNHKGIITKFLKDMGLTAEQPTVEEQPKAEEQPEVTVEDILGDIGMEPQPEEQPEETTDNTSWESLSQEQKEKQTEILLKSLYGIGGENYSSFPTLLDKKENGDILMEYLNKIPSRVQDKTFTEWKANGELLILPIIKNGKGYFTILLLPNKDITLDLWDLEKDGNKDNKQYLKYQKADKKGTITVTAGQYHILNIYTNRNKSFNQGKQLVKLFQLGTTFKDLENQKDEGQRVMEVMVDNSTGNLTLKDTTNGNKANKVGTLGELLGREQHPSISQNILELIG